MIFRTLCVVSLWGLVSSAVLAQAPDLASMDLVLKSVPGGPIAKVNGVSIGRDRFVKLYESELGRAQALKPGENIPPGARVQLGLWCIGTLIEQELLYQEAKKRGFTVSRERIEQEWQEEVDALSKKVSEEGQAKVSEQDLLHELGYPTRETFFNAVERSLLIDRMRAAIVKERGVNISDGELQTAYENHKTAFARPDAVHLSQIYFRAPAQNAAPKAWDEIRKRAENALARIQSGQSFESVARDVSDGTTRADGGDMGMVPLDEMPPFLAAAAGTLRPGEISDLIRSDYGYHIIRVNEIIPGRQSSFEDASPALRGRLIAEKGEQVVREYIDEQIRASAEVLVFLDLEKTLSLNPKYGELRLK